MWTADYLPGLRTAVQTVGNYILRINIVLCPLDSHYPREEKNGYFNKKLSYTQLLITEYIE
jgi:hypothetical protein